MRALLLASSAILPLLAGGLAQAADLPAKAPVYKPPVAYNWTGLYVGGHLGGGWNTELWELLGTRLGSGTAHSFFSFNGDTLPADIKQRINALKFGLNYKFDWSGPFSASY